jgi:hypothetical protein
MKTIIVSLAILVCAACSGEQAKQAEYVAMEVEPAPVQDQVAPQPPAPIATAGTEAVVPRKLIKEGHIEFETSDPDQTRKQIMDASAAYVAYIASDRQSKFSDRLTYTMVIRIPATKFDPFLAAAVKGVDYFDRKEINVKDVTAEYLDHESRIKSKKEIESRYLQLLAKAPSVADILAIEKELGTIRTDIEATEGQLKFLKDQVQFSTLTVSFYKVTSTPAFFSGQVSSAFLQGWKICWISWCYWSLSGPFCCCCR